MEMETGSTPSNEADSNTVSFLFAYIVKKLDWENI